MYSLRKTLFFVGSVAVLSLMVFPIWSNVDAVGIEEVDGNEFGIASGTGTAGVINYITRIVNAGLGIMGLVAVIFIIYAGFLYITAGGDEDQAEKAKHTIMYAVIGLIVIGLAAVIVNFVVGAFKGGPGIGGNPGTPLE